MSEPVTMSVADTVTDQINQAMTAINAAREAMSEPLTPKTTTATWNNPTMPVFTDSGVERFNQEVQNANTLLEQLGNTQAEIVSRTSRMNFLPSNMINDMNTMQSRIQGIQERIQQIENNPLNFGTDQANAELEGLRSQLNQAVQAQEEMNRAIRQMDIETANDAYIRLSNTVSNTERYNSYNRPDCPVLCGSCGGKQICGNFCFCNGYHLRSICGSGCVHWKPVRYPD